jgi:predicted DNA-binding transcriptional regulator YafY
MNKLERLTAILLLLQDRPLTSDAIARHFEVSKRTILRDIQALSEMGVPIIAREGAAGGYSLPTDFRLAPLPLTAHEAFLLMLALSTLPQLSETPYAAEHTSLIAKLRTLLPRQELSNVEQMLAKVAVALPEREQRAPFLEPLMAAAQQGRWVQIEYQSAERRSTQHILPRQIRAENGLWYCRAYADEHAEERVYRVDRILGLSAAPDRFRPPPNPEPVPYDHESHPEIVARLTARGVAAVEIEPHLASHLERESDGSGHLAFRCPPGEFEWYARYFASLGGEVIVTAPPELRQHLRQLGHELVERYLER